ncbi:MAG: hypothetical protein P8016_06590 [Sedimentisphaerales bacterium]|jgi:hypothetical protein
MINAILAVWTSGIIELFLIIIIVGAPIALVIWFIKMITKNKKENIRLRLEVGKLADELEKLRKKDGPNKEIERKEK